jgi:hypothetical protein
VRQQLVTAAPLAMSMMSNSQRITAPVLSIASTVCLA